MHIPFAFSYIMFVLVTVASCWDIVEDIVLWDEPRSDYDDRGGDCNTLALLPQGWIS